jgi:hypothetical protein
MKLALVRSVLPVAAAVAVATAVAVVAVAVVAVIATGTNPSSGFFSQTIALIQGDGFLFPGTLANSRRGKGIRRSPPEATHSGNRWSKQSR